MKRIINKWHNKLDMPKHDLEWHKQDVDDEYTEYKEAVGIIYKWSELSDVVYTYTRASWSGHTDIKFPFSNFQFFIGAIKPYLTGDYFWRGCGIRKVF